MTSKLFRYGHQLNSHDLLKILAILTMILDHIGVFFLWDLPMLRIIGRSAAPVFFFLIGYSKSTRLTPSFFLFGGVLTWLGMTLLDHTFLNILFTFLLCRFVFKYWEPERCSSRQLKILFFPLLALLALPTNWVLEYGTMGLAWAIAGRLVRSKVHERSLITSWTVGCTLLTYFISAYNLQIFSKESENPVLLGVSLCVICSALLLLAKYENRPLSSPKFLSLPFMLIARYSLTIYVAHLLLFYSVLFLFGEKAV